MDLYTVWMYKGANIAGTSLYYKSIHVSTVCTLLLRHFHMFDKNKLDEIYDDWKMKQKYITYIPHKTDINKKKKKNDL